MGQRQGGTTRPTLLVRLVDWSDDEAWSEFVERYRPMIEAWCRRMGLDDETIDELCQRIWIQLARQMSNFEYDPSRKFRGWLRRVVHSRAVDLFHERKASASRLSEAGLAELSRFSAGTRGDVGEANPGESALVQLGREVHETVKRQVSPQTWTAFWSIAIEGVSIRETATVLGLSYAAAFAAHKRVVARLRAEGERKLAERGTGRIDFDAVSGSGPVC